MTEVTTKKRRKHKLSEIIHKFPCEQCNSKQITLWESDLIIRSKTRLLIKYYRCRLCQTEYVTKEELLSVQFNEYSYEPA
jgi:transcription elongation factor Elf1